LAGERNLGTPIRDYFTATRRPLYSIVVAAPFFVAYELGMAYLYPEQPPEYRFRNMAEVILHQPGSAIGRHAAYVLPALLGIALLLFLDWRERKASRAAARPIAFRPAYLGWMLAESLLLALPLPFLLGEIAQRLQASSGGGGGGSLLFQLTSMCGAGAYEELLFRLFLFTGLLWLGQALKLHKLPAGMLAAAVSGVLFAAFHFMAGRPFDPVFFVFAAAAGTWLAAICYFRSFGMAVATHAAYDIMMVLLGAIG
jgi:membrane protease YdiL (CAAX protease family)